MIPINLSPAPEAVQPKEVWLWRTFAANKAQLHILNTVTVSVANKRGQIFKVTVPVLLFLQALEAAPDSRQLVDEASNEELKRFACDWFTAMAHRAAAQVTNTPQKELAHGYA